MSELLTELLRELERPGMQDADYLARYAAAKRMPEVGVEAVDPLVKAMGDTNGEIARSAKKGLHAVVHHAARPGADAERIAVAQALARVLWTPQPLPVRAELLYLIGMVGGDNEAASLAAFLQDESSREEARLALERIGTPGAVRVLADALDQVPSDYQPRIAQSLRDRGRRTRGIPDDFWMI